MSCSPLYPMRRVWPNDVGRLPHPANHYDFTGNLEAATCSTPATTSTEAATCSTPIVSSWRSACGMGSTIVWVWSAPYTCFTPAATSSIATTCPPPYYGDHYQNDYHYAQEYGYSHP